VVSDEILNELIGVVVTGVAPERQSLPAGSRRLGQCIGVQLTGKELIGFTLIDKDIAWIRMPPHQQ
jgi:hypothetical protein